MQKTCCRSGIALLIGSFVTVAVDAAVLNVPANQPTIQRAIDVSASGDLILVSPGVYNESLNFRRKPITLSSTNPADLNVVRSTVIRAVGKRSAVSFITGETSNSILTGFTISGGYGTVNANFGTDTYWGAGIYCYRSSPTIVGNIITENLAPNGDTNIFGYGSGIACIESEALITRNIITANTGYAGGGIATYLGNARISNNLIYSNSVVFGGGLLLLNGGQVINNTLIGNNAQFVGTVYASSDALGRCLITNNIICNAVSGGGIYVGDNWTQMAFNNVWNNNGDDYLGGLPLTGIDGNISEDPQFVDAANNDYHLRDISPCINTGDPDFRPATGELDFYGNARLYAGRVDIGASEYSDNFRPVAKAGKDQVIGITQLPAIIRLDGTSSSDPNGASLSYQWKQISGPAGSFVDAVNAKAAFNAYALGTYTFELIVNNGSFNSFPDFVNVRIKNDAPNADAGPDQLFSDLQQIPSVTLDGSKSIDPENGVLSYRWKQVSGWRVQLNDPTAVNPSFSNPWAGTYLFELVVNDGMQDSKPDLVAIVIGPNHAPIANAGPSRYVASGGVTLDGSGSYDPDAYGTLTYQWKQVSGPSATLSNASTSSPLVGGFTQRNTNQVCEFELVVSDGYLTSLPDRVKVTIVKNFGTNALRLTNPPFDSSKPTIVAFGGGNCTTGSGMTFGGVWEERANWLTVNEYGPAYTRYADMLMVYLSSVAPDYQEPIQTMGFSTGNLPAMDMAWYINSTYKDARYAINRVSLLDAVCTHLGFRVAPFNTNRVAGEQCWVDNYISNDPNYSAQTIINGAFNVVCRPPRNHSYPVNRYSSSSLEYANGGMTAFGYLSLIGAGKNYQLNTASNKYYFVINSTEAVTFFNEAQYPGKALAPVRLTGPANGTTFTTNGVEIGCEIVENAVQYQLLLGTNANRVMDYEVVSDTINPPRQTVSSLPNPHTWWTVRAFDPFGSTIYADPRLLQLPENRAPIADAGPDQTVYAGLDGMAKVFLNGSASIDPDGDALAFKWAWATDSNAYLSNGVSLFIELPTGQHTVQLMVSDGHLDSQPAEVKVTVVAPLECKLKVTPSTLNLRSNGPHILTCIRFPDGFAGTDADDDAALLIHPGALPAMRRWAANDEANHLSLFAFFSRSALADEVKSGPTELTVVGTLRSGRVFYGRSQVEIIGKGK